MVQITHLENVFSSKIKIKFDSNIYIEKISIFLIKNVYKFHFYIMEGILF